jgi:hypothetical protein
MALSPPASRNHPLTPPSCKPFLLQRKGALTAGSSASLLRARSPRQEAF